MSYRTEIAGENEWSHSEVTSRAFDDHFQPVPRAQLACAHKPQGRSFDSECSFVKIKTKRVVFSSTLR